MGAVRAAGRGLRDRCCRRGHARGSRSSRPRRSAGSAMPGCAAQVIGMKTFGASAPLKELAGKFGFTPETTSTRLPRRSSRARSEGDGQSAEDTQRIRAIGLARLRQPRAVEERRADQADRRGRAARRHLEPVDLRKGDRPRRRLRRADRRRRSRPAISIPARCSRSSRSATSRKAPTRCARSTSRRSGATASSVSKSRPIWRCRPTRRSRRRAGCGARSAGAT